MSPEILTTILGALATIAGVVSAYLVSRVKSKQDAQSADWQRLGQANEWLTNEAGYWRTRYTEQLAQTDDRLLKMEARLKLLEGQLELSETSKTQLKQQLDQERTERKNEKLDFEVRVANLTRDNTALQAQVVDLTKQIGELRDKLALLTSTSNP